MEPSFFIWLFLNGIYRRSIFGNLQFFVFLFITYLQLYDYPWTRNPKSSATVLPGQMKKTFCDGDIMSLKEDLGKYMGDRE